MSTELTLAQTLLGELSLKINEVSREPRTLQQLNAGMQHILGLSNDEVVALLQKSYGYVGSDVGDYIEKAEKTDPAPGKLTKLPLADALKEVSIELISINETLGWTMRCLRCGGVWTHQGYQGGDVKRPIKGFWKCPRGCNASAGPLKWDRDRPPSFNPLHGYK